METIDSQSGRLGCRCGLRHQDRLRRLTWNLDRLPARRAVHRGSRPRVIQQNVLFAMGARNLEFAHRDAFRLRCSPVGPTVQASVQQEFGAQLDTATLRERERSLARSASPSKTALENTMPSSYSTRCGRGPSAVRGRCHDAPGVRAQFDTLTTMGWRIPIRASTSPRALPSEGESAALEASCIRRRADIPVWRFTGLLACDECRSSSPALRPGDWKIARTGRQERLPYRCKELATGTPGCDQG